MDSDTEISEKQLRKILIEHGSDVKNLIPILQSIQETYGYLPAAGITAVAEELSISEDVIFGVATFYTHFKFTRPGKHIIRACMGTACFVKEAENLMELIRERLGIEAGETTPDGNITFERVACLGCCALAPTIVVDEEVYGKMTTQKLATVLDEIIADSSGEDSGKDGGKDDGENGGKDGGENGGKDGGENGGKDGGENGGEDSEEEEVVA